MDPNGQLLIQNEKGTLLNKKNCDPNMWCSAKSCLRTLNAGRRVPDQYLLQTFEAGKVLGTILGVPIYYLSSCILGEVPVAGRVLALSVLRSLQMTPQRCGVAHRPRHPCFFSFVWLFHWPYSFQACIGCTRSRPLRFCSSESKCSLLLASVNGMRSSHQSCDALLARNCACLSPCPPFQLVFFV